MQLTVLSSSGTFPAPGKACSGYLVSEGDTHLLLDCGPGTLSRLQLHVGLGSLTAVLITHMHADHFFDLVPLRYALTYGTKRRPAPLPLYLPPGGRRIWERVVAPLDESNGSFSAAFAINEYEAGRTYRLGQLDARFVLLRHYVPNYGVEVRGIGTLVYSGDTGPCPELAQLGSGADLFLCEATWAESDVPPDQRGHLLASEAGAAAAAAGARRLMLTHILPGLDAEAGRRAAQAAFGGDTLVAEEGTVHEVAAPPG